MLIQENQNINSIQQQKQIINTALKQKLAFNAEQSDSDSETESNDNILNSLKIKFKFSTTNRKDKLMMLTLLPETWSISKIMRKFNVSDYMVRQSKKLLQQKGLLLVPDQKHGKTLHTETAEAIRTFKLDSLNLAN